MLDSSIHLSFLFLSLLSFSKIFVYLPCTKVPSILSPSSLPLLSPENLISELFLNSSNCQISKHVIKFSQKNPISKLTAWEVWENVCLKAFCLKLLWRMFSEPNELWVQVIKGKYGRGIERWEMPKVKKGDSTLWKEMAGLWEHFKLHSSIEIGNGRDIYVWMDKWLTQGPPLITHINSDSNINRRLTVNEICNKHGRWELQQLMPLIPSMMVQKIESIPPLSDVGQEDKLRWDLTRNGEFTTASAYNSLQERGRNEVDRKWKIIWKLGVPERVRLFLWQATHDKIATRTVTSKWGSREPYCELCQHEYKDRMHALRDCSNAQTMWKQLIPTHKIGEFFHLD